VLIDVLHVSPAGYAALFACTGGGIVAGAFLNGRLARRGVPPRAVLLAAIVLALLATATLSAMTRAGAFSLPVAMPLLVLATACFGLAAPSAAVGALDPLPELAGVAGGLLTSLQMLMGALASTLVALLFPAFGPLAMSGIMTAAAFAALLVYLPRLPQTAPIAPVAAEALLAQIGERQADKIELDEATTRLLIDDQLRLAGWIVDTNRLRHANGTRPGLGQAIAIAEWPTESGPVDYALFVEGRCVGVIEAKRGIVDVSGRLGQAKRYARGIQLSADETLPSGPWTHGAEVFRIPFTFATNGRPYTRH
jgi:MFS family permease